MLAVIAAALLMSSQTPDADPPLDCANAMTTMEMNDCAAQDVDAEEVRMRAYLERAVQEVRDNSDSPELGAAAAAQMGAAQTAWEAYAKAECDAVYTHWQGGTIRVLMALGCKRQLTYARTQHLWETYLRSMDGSDPILPEPAPLADGTSVNTDD